MIALGVTSSAPMSGRQIHICCCGRLQPAERRGGREGERERERMTMIAFFMLNAVQQGFIV